jgi:hypothetical protein
MQQKYEPDYIEGRPVPPLVIASDHVIDGVHQGTVHLEAGTFELRGRLLGTLVVHPHARAVISGIQRGTISLGEGAHVAVQGAIEGTASVGRGAILVIEATGKLAGTLSNQGTVVLRGVFGGATVGFGTLRIEGDGYIKEPTIRDGVSFYEW